MNWFNKVVEEVAAELEVDPKLGLTSDEASRRLQQSEEFRSTV